MLKTKQTPKGFTLAEIMIVIALMVILSMAALMSSYKTQRYFAFLNSYKEIFQKLRLPRTYSITNQTVSFSGGQGKIPSAYSVEIKLDNSTTPGKYTVKVFGDNPSGTINKYEGDDTVIGSAYELPADRFEITTCKPGVSTPPAPPINCAALTDLTLSYLPNDMRILIAMTPSSLDKFIILRLRDKYYDIFKYIVIFTKSGIVESIDPGQYGIIK